MSKIKSRFLIIIKRNEIGHNCLSSMNDSKFFQLEKIGDKLHQKLSTHKNKNI